MRTRDAGSWQAINAAQAKFRYKKPIRDKQVLKSCEIMLKYV